MKFVNLTNKEEDEIINNLNHERNMIKKAIKLNEFNSKDLEDFNFNYNDNIPTHMPKKKLLDKKNYKEKNKYLSTDKKETVKKEIKNKKKIDQKIFDKLYNENKEKNLKKELNYIEKIYNNDKDEKNLSNNKKRYVNLNGDIEVDVVNRLYTDAKKKKEKIELNEMLKEQNDLLEIKNYQKNKKNKINKNEIPLYERYEEEKIKIENKKKELMIKRELEENNNYFKPKISQISNAIVNKKYKNKNYFDRIKNYSKEKKQKKIELLEKNQENLEKEHTFKPKIITTCLDKNFLKRQEEFTNKVKEKKKNLEQKQKEEQLTFKPEINKISNYIINDKIINSEEKYNKLSIQDAEKKKLLLLELKKEEENKLTFKPKINKNSLKMAKDKEFIYDKEKYNEKLEKIKYEKLIKEQKDCTFKPQTNKKKYNHIKSNIYKYNDEYNDKKILKKELKKKAIEYEELKECSFQPKLNKNQKINFNKDEIKGFDKHLEKMNNLKKKIELQKNYEDEKFNIQKKYCYNKHIDSTEPIPFKLSENKKLKNNNEEILNHKKSNKIIKNKNDLNYITIEKKKSDIAKELINLI